MRRPTLRAWIAVVSVPLAVLSMSGRAMAFPASGERPAIDTTETTTTTVASPGPAVDSVGLRLIEAPEAARDDPRAQIYIVDHLTPGASIERRIEVSSTTTQTAHVELYSSAATINGTSFTGAADRTANDLSSWTSIDPPSIDLAPGAKAIATVSIDVPPDAAPGEQYAVVWAEVRAGSASGGLVQVSRVGIRLYISVGPGGAPAADFSIDALTAGRSDDGSPTVTATVTNTGGRALDMGGTLQVSDGPGGLRAGPFNASLGNTLAIGATEPVIVVLDEQLPAGPWSAEMRLRSGLVERSGHATITFPESGEAAAVALGGPDLWRAARSVIGAALIVAAGMAATLLFRRRQLHLSPFPPLVTRWHWIED